MFTESQEHLGHVQHQRHQGVGQEQELPPHGLIFWESSRYDSCQAWSYWSFEGVARQPGPSEPCPAPKTLRYWPRARTAPGIEFLTAWSQSCQVWLHLSFESVSRYPGPYGSCTTPKHQGVGQGQGLPQGMIFWESCNKKVVKHDQNDHLKVIPDSQDYLANVQHQRDQCVGKGQGLPKGLIFCESCN